MVSLDPNSSVLYRANPWKSMVLMMNPNVGLTVLMSSFMTRLTIVVLPALSRPLDTRDQQTPTRSSMISLLSHSIRIRISLSFSRAFRRMDNMMFV